MGNGASKIHEGRNRVIMPNLIRSTLACMLFLGLAFVAVIGAQIPATEKQMIELLIEQVAQLKETKFVRNGSAYSAQTAATFLRRKWQANDAAVRTARDFIDKVASFSGTSGKPYLIRMMDGTEVKSRDFLLAALSRLEKTMPEKRTTGGERARLAARAAASPKHRIPMCFKWFHSEIRSSYACHCQKYVVAHGIQCFYDICLVCPLEESQ